MAALDELSEVIADGRDVRLFEEGIYTVLADTSRPHHYDRRASAYDLVVGSYPYNAAMWGTRPADYVNFGREAVASDAEGKVLDAGCGSMLFTALSHLNSKRTIIAFDQSLAMLRRARRRLKRLSAGEMPDHIYLVQADLRDLPFRPRSFQTVICLNVLHQFENAPELISELSALRTPEGGLYMTSLVSNGRFVGDRYLKALHAAGEFVRPRSADELKEIAEIALDQNVCYFLKGNMAFITAR